tara:strand:+ start:536 stop:1246 length:711 start_codon:yes stop_codon:yes gene_type:complete
MAHIAIGSTATIAKYTATAGQTAFSIPFEFFDVADIDVYKQGTKLSISTNYNISGSTTYTGGFQGGTMTLTSGATLSDAIVLELNISPVRATDFPTTGGFNIDTLNTWIDKMIVLFKQTFENIDRKVGRASTDASTYALTLPVPTSTVQSLQLSTSGFTLIDRGNVVLNGTSAPSSGTGINGDFYIDSNANNLYGPKAGGSWPTAVTMVGPTGSTGSTGATGSQGAVGVGLAIALG